MSFWIYKCNSLKRPHQAASGDWNEVFQGRGSQEWGSTEWTPAISAAKRGDTILAYQTDRNELVGIARVVGLKRREQFLDLILKPVKEIRVKVRPLKARDPKVAAIEALQPGPIKTLYSINRKDAHRLLRAAGIQIELERKAARANAAEAIRAGRFGSTLENKATETAAVKFVTKHFENLDWEVQDKSTDKLGYDLLCVRGRSIMHVEVKGTAGSKRQFIITVGERRQWSEDKHFVLALVMQARSQRPTLKLYYGPGSVERFHFEALSFMASGLS